MPGLPKILQPVYGADVRMVQGPRGPCILPWTWRCGSWQIALGRREKLHGYLTPQFPVFSPIHDSGTAFRDGGWFKGSW